MPKLKDELTFENGVGRLEKLIVELEDGDISLDRALAVFEEGVGLCRRLNAKLDEAEKKLEVLLKDENGQKMSKTWSLLPDGQDN